MPSHWYDVSAVGFVPRYTPSVSHIWARVKNPLVAKRMMPLGASWKPDTLPLEYLIRPRPSVVCRTHEITRHASSSGRSNGIHRYYFFSPSDFECFMSRETAILPRHSCLTKVTEEASGRGRYNDSA